MIPYTEKRWANISNVWFPQRNCCIFNEALLKHKSKGSFTWWRHRILRHCCWSFPKRYVSIISVYNLAWLCTSKVDRYDKRKLLYAKKKARSRRYIGKIITDADYEDDLAVVGNAPAQAKFLLQARSKQQQALVSSWAQKKQRICVLNEKEPHPL